MTVYRDKGRRTFVYDFWYAGRRYKKNTYQENEEDARLVESKLKLQLRQERGGIATPRDSPSIAMWAGAYYRWCQQLQRRTGRPKRLDRIDDNLRVVLRFFGERPDDVDDPLQPQEGEDAPFYNVALRDLIETPEWLLEFDEWIDRRNVAGSTRNHYYSTMSRMYHMAMLPAYRRITGVTMNPFAGIPRARKMSRKVALTPALVADWLRAMSYHARLAVSIAALAPKLRLQNVLLLDRYEHIDPQVTQITIYDHKTDRITNEPLIVPISVQLRTILLDAFAQMRSGTTRVVQYRGKSVMSIRGALSAAAADANLPWGRFTPGGVTFHTLRHTAATLFARLGVSPWLGRDALGQRELTTTDGYTHLQIQEQRVALEQLSAALPIAELVVNGPRRAKRTGAGATRRGPVGGLPVDPAQKIRDSARPTRGAVLVPGRPFGTKR